MECEAQKCFFIEPVKDWAGMADGQGYCRVGVRQKDGNNIEVI
jgi:hypothetical protein